MVDFNNAAQTQIGKIAMYLFIFFMMTSFMLSYAVYFTSPATCHIFDGR